MVNNPLSVVPCVVPSEVVVESLVTLAKFLTPSVSSVLRLKNCFLTEKSIQ